MTDLASRLVNFFETGNAKNVGGRLQPRSIYEFTISEMSRPDDHIHTIRPLCERLAQFGVLEPAGQIPGQLPSIGSCYYSFRVGNIEWWIHENYGVFDNIAFGFPYIRNKYSQCVKPVIVERKESPSIGSCFVLEINLNNWGVLGESVIVTARHCIEGMSEIRIPGIDWSMESINSIETHADDRVDLALIRFRNPTRLGCQNRLRLSNGNVLEQVMVMGYPPVPGFIEVQIAEVATIASTLISSIGQITATENSYLTKTDYHLISARTKGGSSGGPVLNSAGLLVGIVTDHPANEDGELDRLGYGLATPSSRLSEMLSNPASWSRPLSHKIENGTLSTLP